MTECERYQELISRLTDGEVNSAEHSALISHIEHCSECGSLYYIFSQLSMIIEEDGEDLPLGLHENIMAGVHRSSIQKKNRHRLSRQTRSILAAAACFAVVVLAAVGIVSELSRSSAILRSDTVAVTAATDKAVQSAAKTEVRIAAEDYLAMGSANAAIYAQGSNRSIPVAEEDIYSGSDASADAAVTADPYSGSGADIDAELSPAADETAVAEMSSAVLESPELDSVTTFTAVDSTAAPSPESAASAVTGSGETKSADIGSLLISALGIAQAQDEAVDAIIAQELTVNITGKESWNDLYACLKAQELHPEITVLPVETAEKISTLVLSIGVDEYRVYVYQYPDELYYSVPVGLGEAGIYRAACTVSQFEEYISPFLQ